ncbi:hypothetical protein [Streptomyces sp. CA-106110]|uniref:hypothetical protein n=1 Tax=Streptomyces sp. CA-106110 TaxID=3240044 RepID=UPI003D8BB70D
MTMQEPNLQPTSCRENWDYPPEDPVTPLEAKRRDLVTRYERFLQQEQGHEVTGYLITSHGRSLPVEISDLTARELVVTAATTARVEGPAGVWYAIGALLDLASFFPPGTGKVLLLPGQPSDDLSELCAAQRIVPAWQSSDSFART